MSRRGRADLSKRCQALNNLFVKILWASELALEQTPASELRSELETIARLAQEGGGLVENRPRPAA